MPHYDRRMILRALCLVGCVAGVALVPATASAATCSAPDYPGSGYFTSLKTKKVGCKTGRKVTLAHYHCRIQHGKKGRCTHRVLRYRCTEQRTSIPTELDSRVTCKRGTRRVIYTYQQNL
jgi:hypothetical protein